jgi:hypothetical protein
LHGGTLVVSFLGAKVGIIEKREKKKGEKITEKRIKR